jgi:hypothetical protein
MAGMSHKGAEGKTKTTLAGRHTEGVLAGKGGEEGGEGRGGQERNREGGGVKKKKGGGRGGGGGGVSLPAVSPTYDCYFTH